ncbi:unnamed protein product [Rotaria sp. Silwood1]|nr:unnamed protein product [Rotaria sp. Silwood1]
MTSEDDEDTEMVMEQKSRFSRYRCRVREKINSDLNEAMALDDCSDSEVDNAPITRHQNNSSVENESTVHNNDFNANENQWISQESNQYTYVGDYGYLLDRSIVKSIHVPSMILTELINNLELVAYSTTILQQSTFHPKIALMIQQFLASKKCAVPTFKTQNNKCRLDMATPGLFPHILSYLNATYGE